MFVKFRKNKSKFKFIAFIMSFVFLFQFSCLVNSAYAIKVDRNNQTLQKRFLKPLPPIAPPKRSALAKKILSSSLHQPKALSEFVNSIESIEKLLDRMEEKISNGEDTIIQQRILKAKLASLKDLQKHVRNNFRIANKILRDRIALKGESSLNGRFSKIREAQEIFEEKTDAFSRRLNNLKLERVFDIKKLKSLRYLISTLKVFRKKRLPIKQNPLPIRRIDREPISPRVDGKVEPAYILQREKSPVVGQRAKALQQISGEKGGMFVTAIAPPTQEDLDETIDVVITQEMRDLAASLKNSPARIYEWVKNSIEVEFYYGSLKGSLGTFMEKAGNDADTASLLIALYRAANIPCRYVQGTIDIPMEKARSLTGVCYDNNVGRIFACAGIPVWITSSGKIRFEHTWVEAFVDYIPYAGAKAGEGDTWVPLSPWYKFYDHEDNLDLVSLTGFDRETFLEGFISRVKKEDPIDSYKMFFENYFKENDPDHNWQDGLRTRTLKEERFRTLPCTENFKVISYNGEYAELPDSDRHKVNVSVPEVSLTHIFNVCEIVGKKITYSYPPADQASKDLIDTSGGIENVYPLSVTLLPSLKVEGQTVATGSVVNAGFDHSLRTTFVVPSFSPDSVVYSVISGGYYVLGLDPQYVSNKYLVDRIANYMSTVEDTPETTENMDDITGEALYLALMKYFNDRNQGDKTFAQLQKVIFLKETSGAIMGKTYEVINEWSGLPFDLEPGGYILDSKRDMNTPISITGDADREKDLMYLRGYNSSFNEHDVLEDFFHLEAVSTVKLLAIANERGMPIYDIDSSNISSILPLLGHSDSIKTAIQNAVNQGHTVKVHQDPLQVKEWTGCGYIHRDPVTHAAGYMISGDHAGAITARNKLISLVVFRLGFGPHEGDPVNIASGNLFYGEEDISFPSVSKNITIHRFYNSLADDNGPFGYGWSFTYDEIISEDPVDQSITYRAYDGSIFEFTRNPDGTYENPPGMCCSTLIKDENGVLIRKKCGTRHFFNTEGRLTSIVDRNENTITLSYNTDGKLSAVTDASGSELVFVYNMNNKIESINGPGDNNTIIYTYNGDELVSATNSAGQTVIYAYDGGHKMTSWTNAAGATVAFDYYNDGRVHTNLLPNGGSYLFSYNSPLRITTVTGPEGNSSVHYYNNWGETTGYLDPLGFEELYEYDENLNKTKIIDKRGGITKFTYDSSGNLLTKTDPLNHTTTYSYDPEHNRVAAFTDPGGNITTYNYDTNGNLKSSVDSEGITTEIEYYTNGLMKNFKKAGVKQVEFTYFPNGKIETIMEAAGNTITFTYDELGRITSRTDGIGNTTTYQHDGAGNIVKAMDVKGNETVFTYNELNLRTSMTDASGNITTYEYNSWGELKKEINAQGHEKTFSYNLNGDPATETDENGNTTTYYYDPLLRLSKKVYSNGSEESYTYDPNANLISVTDAKCNTTSYLYDAANRHIQEVYSDGATYTYEYDAVGNKISKTDPNGNTIIFIYDSLKRLTSKSYPDGTIENYTYNAQGRLVSGVNIDSHLSYTYDEMGRITQVVSGMSDNKTVSYDYDAVGNRIFLTTPEGEIVEYGYDNSSLMTEMKLLNGKGIDYTYDSLRRIVRKDYFGGSYSTYGFDDAGRLIQINHLRSDSTEIYTQNNIFDNATNIISKTTGLGTTNYTYDKLYQLTSAIHPIQSQETFTYDPVGNRLTTADYSNWRYNNRNQLISYDGVGFTYDPNGNTITKKDDSGTTQYTYDYDNRLKRVDFHDGSYASYKYDVLDRRSEKDVNGELTRYIYDGNKLLAEYDASGNLKRNYFYGVGDLNPSIVYENNNAYYFQYDHLNTPQTITDGSGAVVWEATYTAFGDAEITTEMVENNIRFPGQYYDLETDLHYNYHRYYNRDIGRYITADPIGMEGGINFYAYVKNNPVNWFDLQGLQKEKFCGSEWTNYIVPDNWILFSFKDACEWHDDCYGGEYELKALSKLECDAKFHDKMMEECKKTIVGMNNCYNISSIYFWAVVILGEDAYLNARTKGVSTKK